MKNFLNILFVFAVIFCCLTINDKSFAVNSGKMFVSPVNIPSVQSSYGAYPDITAMVANDIINSINKYSSYDVPDLNSADALIQSYGLSKHYKEFLMNYRDNRVVDYKICNKLSSKLGIGKILLVSGGFDIQNSFLNKSKGDKYSELFSTMLPFGRIFSKDLIFTGLPFIGGRIYNSYSNESTIVPCYMVNIYLSLVDTDTGLVVWEKVYKKDFPASDFGTPASSFGENIISSEKLKKFSDQISRETSYNVYMATRDSEYKSVNSSIINSEAINTINNNYLHRDGKMTKDGHPYSNNSYLENQRKQSYKNWVKEKTKN